MNKPASSSSLGKGSSSSLSKAVVGGMRAKSSLDGSGGMRGTSSTVYELEPDAKARVRILIAEDNLMNQKVVTKLLHTIGFRSTVANDGKEAYEKYVEEAEAGRPFDLILMDMQMPVMDGLMSTRNIFEYARRQPAESFPLPRIVALTADVAQSVVDECKSCNMYGFISKPIRREKLVDVMEEVSTWVAEGRDPGYKKCSFFSGLGY